LTKGAFERVYISELLPKEDDNDQQTLLSSVSGLITAVPPTQTSLQENKPKIATKKVWTYHHLTASAARIRSHTLAPADAA